MKRFLVTYRDAAGRALSLVIIADTKENARALFRHSYPQMRIENVQLAR